MGPQYVWEFGDGMLGDRFLRFLDLKESNPFISMAQEGFERFFIGDRKEGCNYCCLDFKVPMGLKNFCRELKALFPEEGSNLDALFDDMIAIFDTYKSFFRKHSATEGRFLLATKFLLAGKAPMSMKLKIDPRHLSAVKGIFRSVSDQPCCQTHSLRTWRDFCGK